MSTVKPSGLRARSKVWLERRGRPVFGDGKAELLEQVGRTKTERVKK